jgi:hypothetical protein
MARTGDGCRTILAGRDRFCHTAVFSYNLEDTAMTRSVRSARSKASARIDGSEPCDPPARFDRSARIVRSALHAPEPSLPSTPPRAVVGPDAPADRTACAVCGSPDIAADEVLHRGLWLLGECGRCGHRWTAGPFAGPLPAPAILRPVPSYETEAANAPHAA